MASPARRAARRFSGSSMPTTRPTTARAARPAAKCSPIARCRGCSRRAGRARSTSFSDLLRVLRRERGVLRLVHPVARALHLRVAELVPVAHGALELHAGETRLDREQLVDRPGLAKVVDRLRLLLERAPDDHKLLVLKAFGALQRSLHQVRGGFQPRAVQVDELGLRLGHRILLACVPSPWTFSVLHCLKTTIRPPQPGAHKKNQIASTGPIKFR